jgi:hypothetical protein
MKKLLPIFLTLALFQQIQAQNYYPTQEVFGKNRIQYKPFDWQVITTQNFEVYFYDGGQQMATLAAQFAESDFDRVTEILGYSPFSRTKIFVYNSSQDIYQSNVGVNFSSEKEIKNENLSKSRIEIAYQGDYTTFKKEIIRDISEVFVYDMLYGGSLKDALQNSLLLTVPEWYISGITAYISEGWSTQSDEYMREMILAKRLKRPTQVYGKDAIFVGQSIWNYIAERNGRDNISNILNLTRIIRNEQTSISSTLGMPYLRFLREWRDYYTNLAENVSANYENAKFDAKLQEFKTDGNNKLNKFKISPDGAFLAYSTVNVGKSSVEILDIKSKKSVTLLTVGYKTLSEASTVNTPLLSWTKANSLAVVYESKGDVWFNLFTGISDKDLSGKNEKHKTLKFNQIHNFDISDDGAKMVISAEQKGQNDLFLYDVNRDNYTQLTNDLYDDLYPQFVGSEGKVIFTSNRLKDSLNVDKGTYKTFSNRFKLFLHDGKPKADLVKRLVDSLDGISHPIVADGNTVYFLSDDKGISNIYRLVAGDSTTSQITAFRNSVTDFDIASGTNSLVYRSLINNHEGIYYQQKADLSPRGAVSNTPRAARLKGVAVTQANTINSKPDAQTTTKGPENAMPETSKMVLLDGEVDTDNYQFSNPSGSYNRTPIIEKPVVGEKKSRSDKVTANKNLRKENIKIKGPTEYGNPFVYNGTDGNFLVDPIRGLGYSLTGKMNDLLENHQVNAGAFATFNLKNIDLFAEYSYLPKRIDYSVRFDRKLISSNVGDPAGKNRLNKLTLAAAYPFNTHLRLSVSTSYTATRYLDFEPSNLSSPDLFSDYLGGKAELVYDNTISTGVNTLEGTRMKLKFDHYTGISSARDGFERITADIRHYIKFGQGMILAGRLSGGHSFGNTPQLTSMGGVDNWVFINREDRNSPDNPLNATKQDSRDLFFLDFATNLRGFNINKLSGRSHLLFNLELRIPIVKYLYQGQVYANFFKNLQLIAFTDVGTAWTGTGPFSRKNGFNTNIYGGTNINGTSPFRATVTDFRNPFLVGYGVGARSTIFGNYFLKFDIGWGMENRDVKNPINYLSLGYDF